MFALLVLENIDTYSLINLLVLPNSCIVVASKIDED